MRAFLTALLLVMHLASEAWSGETVLSGDSDHSYLPVQEEREVLLHEFTWLAAVAAPATYLAWPQFNAAYNANCHQQFDYQPSGTMSNSNRDCTRHENAFRAPRTFRLTRVVLRTSKAGTFETQVWAQSRIRVVTVSPSGTITEIGPEVNFQGGVGWVVTWDLAVDVTAGTGVALQARAGPGSSIAVDDIDANPAVELWGIWK